MGTKAWGFFITFIVVFLLALTTFGFDASIFTGLLGSGAWLIYYNSTHAEENKKNNQETDKVTDAIAQLQNSGIRESVPSQPQPQVVQAPITGSVPTRQANPDDELPPMGDFSTYTTHSDPPASQTIVNVSAPSTYIPPRAPANTKDTPKSLMEKLDEATGGQIVLKRNPKPEEEVLAPIGDFSSYSPPREYSPTQTIQPTTTISTPTPMSPRRPQAMIYDIAVPKDSKWTPERATELVEHLLSITDGTAMLRIVATHNEVKWQVVDYLVESDNTASLIRGIRAIYPEAEVRAAPYTTPLFTRPFHRCTTPFVLVKETKDGVPGWVFPIRYVESCKTSDPLTSVIQALSGDLREGSTATLTICSIGFTDDATRKRGKDSSKRSNINWVRLGFSVLGGAGEFIGTGLGELVAKPLTGNATTDRYDKEGQKVVEEKPFAKALWNTVVVLQVDAAESNDFTNYDNTATRLWHGIKSEYNTLTKHSTWNTHIEHIDSQTKANTTDTIGLITDIRQKHLEWKFQCILCAHEIATIFHLPHEGFKSSTIKWIAPGRPNETVLNNKEGVVIGTNGGNDIRIPNTGDAKHTNIIGKSGTGKSTFIHNTIHQNIARGLGVCVIDPHGQIVRDILERSIPDERIDDVVLLDLANTDYPPPFNPFNLADANGQVGIGQIMAVLDKVYNLNSTPRALDYIKLALNTIKFDKNPIIRDAVGILRDPVKRQNFLAKHGHKLDEATVEAWEDFNKKETGHDALLDPVVRRLRQFYQTNYVYAMLCHPHSLDWDRLMKENKIILVSLGVDGQKVPEQEQQLLGALVVSQIELTARRAGRDKPLNFRLYIDEAQKFVTTSLPMMFEEIRKYGVWITIANQFLGQLNGRTLDATMGNVTNTVSFAVGTDDARELGTYMKPTFTVEDLTELGIRRAAIKTAIDGKSQPPFLVDTLPPPPPHPEGQSRVERIKQRSIEQWTPWSQNKVLAWLSERYPRTNFGIPKGDEPNKPDPDNEDFEVKG